MTSKGNKTETNALNALNETRETNWNRCSYVCYILNSLKTKKWWYINLICNTNKIITDTEKKQHTLGEHVQGISEHV